MKHRIASAVVAAGLLAVPVGALAATKTAVPAAHPAAARATVNWQIALLPGAAYPRARGSAQFQSQPGQKELQAEVERIKALAGTQVSFQLNGVTVGSGKVSPRGRAQLSLNTERGQAVPAVAHGSVVTVLDASGVPIASGTF